MSEDDSWEWWEYLTVFGSLASVTGGGILDIEFNNSAFLEVIWSWIVFPIWSGLFVSVKFWHLIAVGAILVGGRYGWLYLYTNNESGDNSNRLTKQDMEEIKKRAEERPDWKDYKSDHIEGVDWTWEWNGKEVANLRPLCPQDDCRWDLELEDDLSLSPDNGGPLDKGVHSQSEAVKRLMLKVTLPQDLPSVVTCDNCGFTKQWMDPAYEVKTNVKREIKGRIRRGDYDT
jgi:hypothetical protein